MSDKLWVCPCCGHVGNESMEINKLATRVAELRAALQSVIHKSYDNNETKQTIELFARNVLSE